MQTIKCFVTANETLQSVRDFANSASVKPPIFVIGTRATLKLRLFANSDGLDAYPLTELQNIHSWQFVMDTDFSQSTEPKVSVTLGITVSTVTDTEGGTQYTEVSIPISDLSGQSLITAIGSSETLNINGELCGYDESDNTDFILQIKNFTIRNRISTI